MFQNGSEVCLRTDDPHESGKQTLATITRGLLLRGLFPKTKVYFLAKFCYCLLPCHQPTLCVHHAWEKEPRARGEHSFLTSEVFFHEWRSSSCKVSGICHWDDSILGREATDLMGNFRKDKQAGRALLPHTSELPVGAGWVKGLYTTYAFSNSAQSHCDPGTGLPDSGIQWARQFGSNTKVLPLPLLLSVIKTISWSLSANSLGFFQFIQNLDWVERCYLLFSIPFWMLKAGLGRRQSNFRLT